MAYEYDLGDTWSPTCTFTVLGVRTDPTAVSLTIIRPDGVVLTYTWAGGEVTKSSTGVFTKDHTLSQRGVWTCVFAGGGVCQASAEGAVTVNK